MKTIVRMAAASIEVNGEVRTSKVIDYEEVDGWVASIRDDAGVWMRWTRSDGATVYRVGSTSRPWVAEVGGQVVVGPKRQRAWASSESAVAAIDREFPRRSLPPGFITTPFVRGLR